MNPRLHSHRLQRTVPALWLTLLATTSVLAIEKEPSMITIETPQDLGYRKRPFGGGWYLEGVEHLDGLEKLTITGKASGTVILRHTDADRVKVRVTRVANSRKSAEAHELLSTMPVYLERLAGEATLTTRDMPSGKNVAVHYHIDVPADVAIAVDLPRATIKAENVHGSIDVRTESVVLELKSPRGDVRLRSETGVVEADFLGNEVGTYDFQTDTGSFVVQLDRDSKTELRARNDEGKIEAFDGLEIIERDTRSIHALHNGGGVGISVQTRQGDIRITRS